MRARLPAAAYAALEKLRDTALRVIVVTAAPAGWCDQMARMWPVDGVIGENGGLFFRRDGAQSLFRAFWHDGDQRRRLAEIGRRVAASVPEAVFADDQPFRLASLAFARPESEETRDAILAALKGEGLSHDARTICGCSAGSANSTSSR